MSVSEFINRNIAGIVPYQPGKPIENVARELNLDPATIAKLASNECPLGPSPKAVKAMKNTSKTMHLYPDGGAYALRHKLAGLKNVAPEQLIFGNGSNELLELIAHAFLVPGTSSVASQYSFVVYGMVTKMMGAEYIEIPADEFAHNSRAMAKAIRPDTRVVFICNPNNPTGTLIKEKELDRFMDKVPENVLVVFDEAYAEICTKNMPDTMKYLKAGRDVIILRTFSKAYGLAGLRVGYGISSPEIIQSIEKARQPFNVNLMAQNAATAALDDDAFVRRSKKLYRQAFKMYVEFCREYKLDYVPTCTNFMLIKTGNGVKVFQELQKEGVIIRPMAPYRLNDWIRISFGTYKENLKCIEALKKVLGAK